MGQFPKTIRLAPLPARMKRSGSQYDARRTKSLSRTAVDVVQPSLIAEPAMQALISWKRFIGPLDDEKASKSRSTSQRNRIDAWTAQESNLQLILHDPSRTRRLFYVIL